MIDLDTLKLLLFKNKDYASWHSHVAAILPRYNIDTPERIAGFFAQCGHESLNFTVLEENLNYSAKALNSIFPKYFIKAGRDAQDYHRKPEKIANIIYGSRMGNGPPESGDGWRFRGMGIIQLTGKNNVRSFGDSIGHSIEETSDYLTTRRGALESACWYWNSRKLNDACDNQDIKRMTKLVNGGTIGLADRTHHWERNLKVLRGEGYTPKPSPILLKIGAMGADVKKVQKLLGLDADGVFGRMTEKAVKAWQIENGMKIDGVVGPKTFMAMF